MEQSAYGMCLDMDHHSSMGADWFRLQLGHLLSLVCIRCGLFHFRRLSLDSLTAKKNDNCAFRIYLLLWFFLIYVCVVLGRKFSFLRRGYIFLE